MVSKIIQVFLVGENTCEVSERLVSIKIRHGCLGLRLASSPGQEPEIWEQAFPLSQVKMWRVYDEVDE